MNNYRPTSNLQSASLLSAQRVKNSLNDLWNLSHVVIYSMVVMTTLIFIVAKPRTCIRYFRSTNVNLKQTDRPFCLLSWRADILEGIKRNPPKSHCKAQGWAQTLKSALWLSELAHHNCKYQTHISVAVPKSAGHLTDFMSGPAAVTPVCTRSLRLLFGWKLFWSPFPQLYSRITTSRRKIQWFWAKLCVSSLP